VLDEKPDTQDSHHGTTKRITFSVGGKKEGRLFNRAVVVGKKLRASGERRYPLQQ